MNMIGKIHGIVWGPWTPVLFLMVGFVYSVRIRFFQIRKIPDWWNATIGNLLHDRSEHRGSFRSACTALAATVGTGNIAGVAGAIAIGGPGAVFWMWVSAFLGMATAYGETVLGIRYREKGRDGGWIAGPMMYLEKRLGCLWAAVLYGSFCIPAAFGMGSMVQANAIAGAFYTAFNVPTWVTGIFTFIIAGFIFIGGIRRIASFAEKMVPIMALIYVIGSLTIIFTNLEGVMHAFEMIFVGAFDPMAATGGVIGAGIKEAIRYGVARGLFSNEAGMGSTPHAHAVARVKHPAEQGLAAIIGLFIDTFIVVNMTAFVILCTGSLDGTTTGIALTQKAFTLGLGTIGNGFVAVCLLFFAFTTIVGWYFFAEQNVKYLVGVRYVSIYRVLVLAFIMAGSFLHVTLVWELADLFNGLMAIPNIIALIGLSKVVGRALEDYEKKFLAGETPEFGELAPVPADIPRYNGAPAQDPALEPKPQHHRRLGGLRNRFPRRPHNAQENDA